MQTTFSHRADHQVKKDFMKRIKAILEEVITSSTQGESVRGLEKQVWRALLEIGQLLLALALNIRCRQATEQDIKERGLDQKDVKLRNESDYWYCLTTTFGPVRFFSYAYRDLSTVGGTVTRVPARKEVVPLYSRTHSSELCLEWESRLGSEHPFRKAQEALSYFSHGAVQLEDTTIARHMVTAAKLIDPDWLYRDPEDIRTLLRERASRDTETEQPVLYLSTDAHALRRYVDETWDAQWKMANGIRLWCVDRNNGAIIHLGGEYTWGDCEEVADIIERLVMSGHLAEDGDYGDGVSAKLVVIVDGAPWIENHVLPQVPWAVSILDAYHALEHVSDYAAIRFGKGSREATDFYDDVVHCLLGRSATRKKKPKKRKGHKKRHRGRSESAEAIRTYAGGVLAPMRMTGPEKVLDFLILDDLPETKKHEKARDSLVNYFEENRYRMDYILYRTRGYQIGSGAMESLHRTASQARLKIPGGRWLEETSQAIFNLRMMAMVGKWGEFWNQPDLTDQLIEAFNERKDAAKEDVQEAA
jgi:hypothetical protein